MMDMNQSTSSNGSILPPQQPSAEEGRQLRTRVKMSEPTMMEQSFQHLNVAGTKVSQPADLMSSPGASNMSNADGDESEGIPAGSMMDDTMMSAGTVVGSPQPTPGSGGRGRKRRSESSDAGTPKRGRGGGRGRGRGRGAAASVTQRAGSVDMDDEDTSSIFAIVRNGRLGLPAVVDQWIEEYQRTPNAALVKLLQFFVSAAGCKGVITERMLIGMEFKDIIQRMTEEFDEEGGDYPLIMGAPYKKFRQNMESFINTLIEKCKQEILHDQKMMDNVIQLLTGLADSQVRAFRHTATYAALKMMTAVVSVIVELLEMQERNQRQIDTETAKPQQARNRERLEFLLSDKEAILAKSEEARQMVQYLFKAVFVHRYRDIVADIRCICIGELGLWVAKHPDSFLEDTYLKYIGWLLYDKVPEVRTKCLETLVPLYEQTDMVNKLELFTNRFKDRIARMAYDREPDVSVLAIKVMTAMMNAFDDLYTDQEGLAAVDRVYDLVYSTNKAVAAQAGQFLNSRVFATRVPANVSSPQKRSVKVRSPNESLLVDLVNFFAESMHHTHAAYLVDTLIDTNEIVRDWKAMTDLLLEEPLPGNEPLNNDQETKLIEMMMCAVKQLATGEAPVGRVVHKKGPNTKERDDRRIAVDKGYITDHFVPVLPLLLNKYLADPQKLEDLLQVPLHFNQTAYMSGRNAQALEALLKCLEAIVERNTDDNILIAVANVLEQLSNEQTSAETRVQTFLSKLIDAIVIKFRQVNQAYANETMIDLELESSMKVCWRKVAAFHKYHDLNKWDLWEIFLQIIDPQDEHKPIPIEVREQAVQCGFMSIAWDALRITDDREPNKQLAVERLATRRIELVTAIQQNRLLADNSSLCQTTFVSLCDMCHLFNAYRENDPVSRAIRWEPDPALQESLSHFVSDCVFDADAANTTTANSMREMEDLNARTYRRRSMLTAYCKLIVFGVLPLHASTVVFKNLLKEQEHFGDIIKHTIGKAREFDKLMCARVLVKTLQECYAELRPEDGGEVNIYSDEFVQLRELAKRFSMSFGLDSMKNREAIATIHRDGIIFSLESEKADVEQPENLTFLDVLREFCNKLMTHDKPAVLRYLDKHIPNHPDAATWEPLLLYKNALQEKTADDASSVVTGTTEAANTTKTTHTGRGRGGGRGRGRGRGRPARSHIDDDDD